MSNQLPPGIFGALFSIISLGYRDLVQHQDQATTKRKPRNREIIEKTRTKPLSTKVITKAKPSIAYNHNKIYLELAQFNIPTVSPAKIFFRSLFMLGNGFKPWATSSLLQLSLSARAVYSQNNGLTLCPFFTEYFYLCDSMIYLYARLYETIYFSRPSLASLKAARLFPPLFQAVYHSKINHIKQQ